MQSSAKQNQNKAVIYWANLCFPFYSYSLFDLQASLKPSVYLAIIDAPIKTLYFLVGVSITRTFTEDVVEPFATFSWNLW